MPAERRILRIDQGDKAIYEELRNACPKDKHYENKDYFMLALFYGFMHQTKRKIEKPDATFTRYEYFNDDEQALLKAIAFNDAGNNPDVLLDLPQIATIVESYASWGIRYIDQLLAQHGDFTIKLEDDILTAVDMIESRT